MRGAARALVLLALLVITGCTGTKPTRVILVGGAGLSQLGDLGETIAAMCPDADVVETGGWDGFRGDAIRAATEPPCEGVILIGHSFGCQTVAAAAAELKGVDMIVLIDPSWDDITLTRRISCIWYQRADDGGAERRALVNNGGRPIVVADSHNGICHNPRVIQQVAKTIRDISDRRGMQQRLRAKR
jgi:pimeloyl-ACP methyl ester carboxylesterase